MAVENATPYLKPEDLRVYPLADDAEPSDSAADRISSALERIADALEARNAIDGQMAEFAELLQQGAPHVAHEGHPDLAPDGMPRKRR